MFDNGSFLRRRKRYKRPQLLTSGPYPLLDPYTRKLLSQYTLQASMMQRPPFLGPSQPPPPFPPTSNLFPPAEIRLPNLSIFPNGPPLRFPPQIPLPPLSERHNIPFSPPSPSSLPQSLHQQHKPAPLLGGSQEESQVQQTNLIMSKPKGDISKFSIETIMGKQKIKTEPVCGGSPNNEPPSQTSSSPPPPERSSDSLHSLQTLQSLQTSLLKEKIFTSTQSLPRLSFPRQDKGDGGELPHPSPQHLQTAIQIALPKHPVSPPISLPAAFLPKHPVSPPTAPISQHQVPISVTNQSKSVQSSPLSPPSPYHLSGSQNTALAFPPSVVPQPPPSIHHHLVYSQPTPPCSLDTD